MQSLFISSRSRITRPLLTSRAFLFILSLGPCQQQKDFFPLPVREQNAVLIRRIHVRSCTYGRSGSRFNPSPAPSYRSLDSLSSPSSWLPCALENSHPTTLGRAVRAAVRTALPKQKRPWARPGPVRHDSLFSLPPSSGCSPKLPQTGRPPSLFARLPARGGCAGGQQPPLCVLNCDSKTLTKSTQPRERGPPIISLLSTMLCLMLLLLLRIFCLYLPGIPMAASPCLLQADELPLRPSLPRTSDWSSGERPRGQQCLPSPIRSIAVLRSGLGKSLFCLHPEHAKEP